MSKPLFNCPKFRSQLDLQLLLQVKKQTKNIQIVQMETSQNNIKLASDKT